MSKQQQHGISEPLQKLADKLSDSQLRMLGIELAQSVQRRFSDQTEKWKDTSDFTKSRKTANKNQILVEKGTLKKSIKTVVQNGRMYIGTNVIYGRIHDKGGKIKVTAKQRKYLHSSNIMHLKKDTTEIKIPKRRWLFIDAKQRKLIKLYLQKAK